MKKQKVVDLIARSIDSWIKLPDGTPSVPEYYDRNDYWPNESLERRKVMLARPRP